MSCVRGLAPLAGQVQGDLTGLVCRGRAWRCMTGCAVCCCEKGRCGSEGHCAGRACARASSVLAAATAHRLCAFVAQVAVCCLLAWIVVYSVRCASPRILTRPNSRRSGSSACKSPESRTHAGASMWCMEEGMLPGCPHTHVSLCLPCFCERAAPPVLQHGLASTRQGRPVIINVCLCGWRGRGAARARAQVLSYPEEGSVGRPLPMEADPDKTNQDDEVESETRNPYTALKRRYATLQRNALHVQNALVRARGARRLRRVGPTRPCSSRAAHVHVPRQPVCGQRRPVRDLTHVTRRPCMHPGLMLLAMRPLACPSTQWKAGRASQHVRKPIKARGDTAALVPCRRTTSRRRCRHW